MRIQSLFLYHENKKFAKWKWHDNERKKKKRKLVSGKRNLVWGVNLRQMQRLNLFCGLKFNFNIQTHLESIFAHCFLLSHFFNIKYSNNTFINLQNLNTSSYLSSLLSKHHTKQNKLFFFFFDLKSHQHVFFQEQIWRLIFIHHLVCFCIIFLFYFQYIGHVYLCWLIIHVTLASFRYRFLK